MVVGRRRSHEKTHPPPRRVPVRAWPSAGRGGQAPEHPVHDVRRPRRRGHQRLRLVAQGLLPHADPRPARRRGHALHQCLLQQLHLLAQPRQHHQRPILTRHRRAQPRLPPQAERPELHPRADQQRLRDVRRRQVAHAAVPARRRRLRGDRWPGQLLQPNPAPPRWQSRKVQRLLR